MRESSAYATHEVLNQPPPLEGYDAFAADPALPRIVRAFGADWAADRLARTGVCVGSAEVRRLARLANRHIPELVTHDRFGRRIDQIDFHPAWHELMRRAMADEVHRLGWVSDKPGSHAARAARAYLWSEAEP